MTNESIIAIRSEFCGRLCHVVSEALGQLSGTSWQITESSDAAIDDAVRDESILVFADSLQGEVTIAFDRTGIISLTDDVPAPAEDVSVQQTEKLLQHIETGMNAFCAAAVADYGLFSVTVHTNVKPDAKPSSENMLRYTAVDEKGRSISFFFGFSALILDGLGARMGQGTASTSEESITDANKSVLEPVNLDLVLDVELNVTLRFGQRILSLREVLDLTSGSVIELDRQVEEPVELLLDGKVIARGEAVVIDGNYGLRVTDVPQPISSQMLA